MAFCIFCGQQNDDDSAFCIGCGKPLSPAQEQVDASYTSPAAEVMFGKLNDPFQPRSGDAIQAFIEEQDEMDDESLYWGDVEPQPTVDIYAMKGNAVEEDDGEEGDSEPEREPGHEPEPEPPAGKTGPAHAASSSDDVQDEVLEAVEKLDGRLASLEGLLGELSEKFESKISRNSHEAAVLKGMSDEMQEYRDDLYSKLTLPLVRDIIEVREALRGALARYEGADEPCGDTLAEEVKVCCSMLADSLGRNAVEIVPSSEGDDFVSFKHKIVGKVHTDKKSKHGKLAEVAGDSYKMGDQFISPAMVKVFTIEETGE